PRVDITAIDVSESTEEIQKTILEERYSRIPVYKDDIDNIIGILHTRDYLEELMKTDSPNMETLIKPAYFIYKTKKLSHVLTELKKQKLHIAIVTDDYGGTLGIVTMEDLLEELVGDIWDEDEVETLSYQKIDESTYHVSGDMTISDMLELLELREDYIDSDSVSVGGWVMENLGDIPQKGDSFTFGEGLVFTVLETDGQRVEKIKIEYTDKKE
ncbi:MAG: HlyC/CorC family transporter, partial [Clostridia bacterium]|nr:HlyC/CorC family transporter [Clostridia bacterium]